MYSLKKGYHVFAYEGTTWVGATDTFTYGSIFIYTPAKGAYQVSAGSKVVISGNLLVVSATDGSYTPLNNEFDGSGTAYLISVQRASFNYNREGVVIIGSNFVDYFQCNYNVLDPAYWTNITTKTTADTATTNIASTRNARWNNVGMNAAALSTFITKLRERVVDSNNLLNLVCWGDSIFGRLYRSEMTEASSNIYSPPGMYRNNIARKILDNFQISGGNIKYYPVKNMTGFVTQDSVYAEAPTAFPADNSFITLTGTWVEFTNNDYQYYKRSSTLNSKIEIQLEAGFSKAALIAQRSADATGSVNVRVSVNGGAYQTPTAAGLTGGDTFSLVKANGTYTNRWQRHYRQLWTGLNTANTYKFEFTLNDANIFWVWGMEAWDTASLRVINAARGSNTMADLKGFLYDDVINTNYKPDASLFELTMLNDSYVGGGTPTFAQELVTLQNLDIVLSKIAESGIPTLCIIPHQSSTEPGHYEKYIQFARSYAAKYGIPTMDMYSKWKELALDGRADGTHLNDTGVTSYYDEIAKVIKADGPVGSISKTPAYPQSGLLASVGTITFNTPYLAAPKVTIIPVKDAGIVPDVYLDGNPTTTGFTVAGTGKFNWEAKL